MQTSELQGYVTAISRVDLQSVDHGVMFNLEFQRNSQVFDAYMTKSGHLQLLHMYHVDNAAVFDYQTFVILQAHKQFDLMNDCGLRFIASFSLSDLDASDNERFSLWRVLVPSENPMSDKDQRSKSRGARQQYKH